MWVVYSLWKLVKVQRLSEALDERGILTEMKPGASLETLLTRKPLEKRDEGILTKKTQVKRLEKRLARSLLDVQ